MQRAGIITAFLFMAATALGQSPRVAVVAHVEQGAPVWIGKSLADSTARNLRAALGDDAVIADAQHADFVLQTRTSSNDANFIVIHGTLMDASGSHLNEFRVSGASIDGFALVDKASLQASETLMNLSGVGQEMGKFPYAASGDSSRYGNYVRHRANFARHQRYKRTAAGSNGWSTIQGGPAGSNGWNETQHGPAGSNGWNALQEELVSVDIMVARPTAANHTRPGSGHVARSSANHAESPRTTNGSGSGNSMNNTGR